jgi:hypothetical protein
MDRETFEREHLKKPAAIGGLSEAVCAKGNKISHKSVPAFSEPRATA